MSNANLRLKGDDWKFGHGCNNALLTEIENKRFVLDMNKNFFTSHLRVDSNSGPPRRIIWILKTRELRGLTRATTDGNIEDVQDLVAFVMQHLKSNVHCVLEPKNVDQDTMSVVDDVFDSPVTKPFNGVMSFYQQLQYCQKT